LLNLHYTLQEEANKENVALNLGSNSNNNNNDNMDNNNNNTSLNNTINNNNNKKNLKTEEWKLTPETFLRIVRKHFNKKNEISFTKLTKVFFTVQ
jgi:hypothetical protein